MALRVVHFREDVQSEGVHAILDMHSEARLLDLSKMETERLPCVMQLSVISRWLAGVLTPMRFTKRRIAASPESGSPAVRQGGNLCGRRESPREGKTRKVDF